MVVDQKDAALTVETNHELKYLLPLPILDHDKLRRSFTLDYSQIEVTSLDITSHGCYVLAGCSNGMILLYDLTSTQQQGHIIGHIFAKGLHTNLLLNVKVTEDCRFCFAGVHKGSSELLAIDLGFLPVNNLATVKPNQKQTSTSFPYEVVKTFRYSDAKLRGFSAAVRVGLPSEAAADTYRLACGKGIKNVHVWQFKPSCEGKDPVWTCICDVPSNGMTIENIVFRADGRQVISKSSDANLRVWDLSSYDESDGNTFKPPYEDISNSQDMKAVLDSYAFGGTYNFAVVKLAAPKAANRDSFEMPERSIEDSQGNRRKR
jgi:WD40 repeat protein